MESAYGNYAKMNPTEKDCHRIRMWLKNGK